MSILTILLTSIFVFSDPHVLPAADTVAGAYKQNPRLVEHSQEMFDSVIAVINTENPDIVLIPGDLTNNGEVNSHTYVANALQALQTAGRQVYVIPGNHDIHEGVFGHDQWLSTYGAFGFQNAVLSDSTILNYMVYPTAELALIGVNSCEQNDSTTHSQGGITRENLNWIVSAAQRAIADGRHPILMVHHPLVAHYTDQATFAPTYLANTDSTRYPALDSVQNVLREAGIMVSLTGHHHIHSIKYAETDNGRLYDITTGSTCSFSSEYRRLTYANDSLIGTTDSVSKYWLLEQQRNAAMAQALMYRYSVVAYNMIQQYKSSYSDLAQYLSYMRIPSSVEETYAGLSHYMLAPCAVILNDLCRGNEHTYAPDEHIQAVKDSVTSFANYVFNPEGLEEALGGLFGPIARNIVEGVMGTLLENKIFPMIDPVMESIEYNKVGEYSTVDDRTIHINLSTGKTPVAENKVKESTTKSLRDGRLVIQRGTKRYSILGAAL